jgi:cupin 2 domain-containing protein
VVKQAVYLKTMHADNIFESIPEDLEKEIFESLVQSSNVTVERIISRGHSSPATGWYDQPRDEWVMLVRGEAVLSFENGSEVRLKEGDHINIPAHTRHKVSWTHPDTETIWLAVHY